MVYTCSAMVFVFGLVYFRTGVGPLLAIGRLVDRLRAVAFCARLSAVAFGTEWRRMWAPSVARAQRER